MTTWGNQIEIAEYSWHALGVHSVAIAILVLIVIVVMQMKLALLECGSRVQASGQMSGAWMAFNLPTPTFIALGRELPKSLSDGGHVRLIRFHSN